MLIKLPFPDSRLSPNRKNGTHWSTTNAVKKQAYEYAYSITREAMASEKWHGIPIGLELVFVQHDKRKRDLDNLLASSKAQIDGVCKALGVDDYQFETIKLARWYDKQNSALLIKVIAKP